MYNSQVMIGSPLCWLPSVRAGRAMHAKIQLGVQQSAAGTVSLAGMRSLKSILKAVPGSNNALWRLYLVSWRAQCFRNWAMSLFPIQKQSEHLKGCQVADIICQRFGVHQGCLALDIPLWDQVLHLGTRCRVDCNVHVQDLCLTSRIYHWSHWNTTQA